MLDKIKISLLFFGGLLFLVFGSSDAKAALPSQCQIGSCSGSQSDCSHPPIETAVLSQCQSSRFSSSCSSLSAYLGAMRDECNSSAGDGSSVKTAGKCDTIPTGAIYGFCAADYAAFTPTAGTDCLTTRPQGECVNDADPCPGTKTVQSGTSGCGLGQKCCANGSSFTGSGITIPDNTGLPDPAGGIQQILKNLLIWLLEILGIIALISFIIAGIIYLISTGDETMIERAKKAMMWSIVGVIVALSGFVIIKAIEAILKAEI